MKRTVSNESKAAGSASAKQAWISPAVKAVAAREAEGTNSLSGSDGPLYS